MAAKLADIPGDIDAQTLVGSLHLQDYKKYLIEKIGYGYRGDKEAFIARVSVYDVQYGKIIEISIRDDLCINPDLVSEVTGLSYVDNLDFMHAMEVGTLGQWRYDKSGVKFPKHDANDNGIIALPYGPSWKPDGPPDCYQTIRIDKRERGLRK